MRPVLLLAAIAMSFIGCADKATISCPSCTIENNSYTCTECKVEAEISGGFSLVTKPLTPNNK